MKPNRTMVVAVLAAALFAVAAPVVLGMPSWTPMDFALLSALGLLGSLAEAKKFREQRATLVEQNAQTLEKIRAETDAAKVRELEAEWDKRDAEIDRLTKAIEREEKQESRGRELETPTRERLDRQQRSGLSENPEEAAQQQRQAFGSYLRFGRSGMTDEERGIVFARNDGAQQAVRDALSAEGRISRSGVEHRDLVTTTSGVVIPREYWNQLEQSMLAFGGMREVATVIRTANGAQLTFPTVNDTANQADQVGEAVQTTTSVDPTLGSMSLDAYTYRSFVLVSRELVQDWQFDLDAWIRNALAVRLARRLNQRFTTGTGSSQPNGIITASNAGFTMASGNSVAYADFVELEHSVDPAYRRGGRYMFHDSVLKAAKKMVDTQNRPLWVPGVAVKEPDTVLGYPYTINQDMAPLDSGGDKCMIFGQLAKYIIRDVVEQMVILRLEERYADYGQIGYLLFSRHDGDLLDAGTDPVKHAVTPSP